MKVLCETFTSIKFCSMLDMVFFTLLETTKDYQSSLTYPLSRRVFLLYLLGMLAYCLDITESFEMSQKMTAEVRVNLREMLIRHEEYSKYPYPDIVGKITIGIGYNLTDRGLPDRYINELFNEDVDFCYSKLSENFVWFDGLSDDRKIVLLNMCYNLGWKRFLTFKKMLSAIEEKNYKLASDEMLDSNWAKQVGKRATELAYIMEEGLWPS